MSDEHSKWCVGLVVLLFGAACGPAVSQGSTDGDGSTSTSVGSATMSDGSSSPTPTTSPVDPTLPPATSATTSPPSTGSTTGDGSSSAGPDDSGIAFLIDPDWGIEGFECDLFLQDCRRGEKCTSWANDGGSAWNATRCVPVADDSDGVGDPCTVEGSPVSGIDSCDALSMCFNVNAETGIGECYAFCTGSSSEPTCDDGFICPQTGDGVVAICLPTCDPIAPDVCSDTEVCVPIGDQFLCAAATELDGAFLDPCAFVNACEAGLLCAPATALDGCAGAEQCCTPFCDLDDPACPGTTGCTAFFDEGTAPAGLEHVGVCVNE